jgi:hypothetical protein
VLGRGNPIANIASLDGIRARTLLILSKNCHRQDERESPRRKLGSLPDVTAEEKIKATTEERSIFTNVDDVFKRM